jgi:hypothetical protein
LKAIKDSSKIESEYCKKTDEVELKQTTKVAKLEEVVWQHKSVSMNIIILPILTLISSIERPPRGYSSLSVKRQQCG